MVAVIKTGYSLRRILHYNEHKVAEGVADALLAGNYPMDMGDMTFMHKLNGLMKQAELNEKVARNCVHISLNFAPGEELSETVLKDIAAEYMEGIGFGEQPYLVYRHHDAGHPHIHIVSVKVRADGSRIDTQNIGRNQSEAARKAIEIKHGLVKAEDHRRQSFSIRPVNAQRVAYGRAPTKRAISNVLTAVLNAYTYTSLAELNAVLMQYNVVADRGSEDSRIYRNEGLVYRVLDTDGKVVGVPVKASAIHDKPTLKYIRERFGKNKNERQKHQQSLRNCIDKAFISNRNISLEELKAVLKKSGIDTVLRQNDTSLIYGITFVDHRTKCVFNGSALGKPYSASAIQQRCGMTVDHQLRAAEKKVKKQDGSLEPGPKQAREPEEKQPGIDQLKSFFQTLMQPDQTLASIPFELKSKRKKKKKKRPSNQ